MFSDLWQRYKDDHTGVATSRMLRGVRRSFVVNSVLSFIVIAMLTLFAGLTKKMTRLLTAPFMEFNSPAIMQRYVISHTFLLSNESAGFIVPLSTKND